MIAIKLVYPDDAVDLEFFRYQAMLQKDAFHEEIMPFHCLGTEMLETWHYVLIEEDMTILGWCAVHRRPQSMYIQYISTRSRQGYGSELIRSVLSDALHEKVDYLYVLPIFKTQSFYHKLGFVPLDVGGAYPIRCLFYPMLYSLQDIHDEFLTTGAPMKGNKEHCNEERSAARSSPSQLS